jgi:very-short-patch-repair endonuclease
MSELEEELLWQMHVAGLPIPIREYKFHPTRKWRFDLAYPEQKIAIEAEGATFANGRHSRGVGFQADCEKYNTATLMGWRVLRFTRAMVEGNAAETIKQLLETGEKNEP